MIIIKQTKNIRLVNLDLHRYPIYQIQKKNWLGKWITQKFDGFMGDPLDWFADKLAAEKCYNELVEKNK